jgi:hypothetical protein
MADLANRKRDRANTPRGGSCFVPGQEPDALMRRSSSAQQVGMLSGNQPKSPPMARNDTNSKSYGRPFLTSSPMVKAQSVSAINNRGSKAIPVQQEETTHVERDRSRTVSSSSVNFLGLLHVICKPLYKKLIKSSFFIILDN